MTSAEITRKEMTRRGEAHARAGRQCTPFDCQEVDRELLALSKTQERPMKWYAAMRGAFNKGWQAEHFKMTDEPESAGNVVDPDDAPAAPAM